MRLLWMLSIFAWATIVTRPRTASTTWVDPFDRLPLVTRGSP